MNVEHNVVVTFTEKDKEALRHLYTMIQNFDCQDHSDCPNCPFGEMCHITRTAYNGDLYVERIRKRIEDLYSD